MTEAFECQHCGPVTQFQHLGAEIIIIMEIYKAPTLRLKALNGKCYKKINVSTSTGTYRTANKITIIKYKHVAII